jgi:hypothetical protein
MPMHIGPKSFARGCRQMVSIIATCDAETADALLKLCDQHATITRPDAEALGCALLLELRANRGSRQRR